MAKKKAESGVAEQPAASAKAKKFDPASLSNEEQAAVVEHYLGVHPEFFVYEGFAIKADPYLMQYKGANFNGWKQDPNKI